MTDTEKKRLSDQYENNVLEWAKSYDFPKLKAKIEREYLDFSLNLKYECDIPIFRNDDERRMEITRFPVYQGNNFVRVTGQEKWVALLADVDFYFRKQRENWAFQDDYPYDALRGTEFFDPSVRAQYYYIHYKIPGYKIDFPSP